MPPCILVFETLIFGCVTFFMSPCITISFYVVSWHVIVHMLTAVYLFCSLPESVYVAHAVRMSEFDLYHSLVFCTLCFVMIWYTDRYEFRNMLNKITVVNNVFTPDTK